MATIFDVSPTELIKKAAEGLKNSKEVRMPEWALYVKTSVARARPPYETEWWYVRAASVLRKIYLLGPIGVNKLRRKYGGRKRRGYKPEKYFRGSGKIVRTILQQLTKEGLIKSIEKRKHKGKIITPKGESFLNKSAKQIKKA